MEDHADVEQPRGRWRTLAACYESGQDNFLLLRFIAAAAVIFGHSYHLSGIPNAGDFIERLRLGDGIYTGSLAVDVFFVVSGFLVTASYLHRANLETFLKSRALRLLPAYSVCMLLSAFVVGAIYTELPLSDYWASADTRGYVVVNMQFGSNLIWTLPGVFLHNPYQGVVNGSIWTLPSEVHMYLWVAAFGMLGVLRKRWLANCVFVALIVGGALLPEQLPHPDFVRLSLYFLAGAFCYINRDWIPVSEWPLVALLLLAYFARGSSVFPWVFGCVVAYGSLWFAYRPDFLFFNRFGDYSYGLYLWGFPIEQAVMHWFNGPTRPILIFVISLPLALLCAMLSWHFVEKPALSLKKKIAVPIHELDAPAPDR